MRAAGQVNVVKLVYFSGTGNTKRVADCFQKVLKEHGKEVLVCELKEGRKPSPGREDLLFVIYAVHACNAPEPVYEWIDGTPEVKGIPAVVISVSGGGEVSPNTACRVSCIKKLEKKGYEVSYEKMVVMPSNWMVSTKEPLAVRLLEVLPSYAERIVKDVLSDVKNRTKPLFHDRLLSALGELEKSYARKFGKKIETGEDCNGCGWCERNCPRDNIRLENGKPVFSNKCLICLNCIYGCPNKALKPGILKFVVIKDGYSLKDIEKKMPYPEPVDVEKLAKGYLWKGVKEYLLDCEG